MESTLPVLVLHIARHPEYKDKEVIWFYQVKCIKNVRILHAYLQFGKFRCICIRTTATHIMENTIDITIAPKGVNFFIFIFFLFDIHS